MPITASSGDSADLAALINALPFQAGRRNESVVSGHLALLETLAAMDGISVALYDLAERRYRLLRTVFRGLLDLPDDAPADGDLGFFAERLHPDDRRAYFGTSKVVLTWLMERPAKERKDYCSYMDFRIMGASGSYMRLAQQNTLLETDDAGIPWLVLTIIERSRIIDCGLPLLRSCKKKSNGEFCLFAESERSIAPLISRREAEILSLVSRGFSSSDIAGLLSLSVHTVNTHRRNILGKLDAENASDAVRYAAERGFI